MTPEAYPKNSYDKGVWSTTLPEWKRFHDFVNNLLDLPHYAFRGQRRDDWLLESTLTREFKKKKKTDGKKIIDAHLKNFRFAIRGRRTERQRTEIEDDEDALWALGQHHGLATPLLDWSMSPYVALFFAMAKADPLTDTEHRVVYCLNILRIGEKNNEAEEDPFSDGPIVFFNPLADDNARLVSQNGMFTKVPYNQDLESWVKRAYDKNKDAERVLLAKVLVPSTDRIACLKALNRMNINFASLFPDLLGASEHSNLKLQIENY
jgi:hypothetical protein